DFILLRYNTNGIPDSTFNEDGIVTTEFSNSSAYAFGSAIQNDNKILLAGVAGVSVAIVRYLSEVNTSSFSFTQQPGTESIYPNPVTSKAILEYNLINGGVTTI